MSRHHSLFGKRKTIQRLPKKVLIVCEGEKTEPNYFRSFSINKELIDVEVLGAGKNTDSLVEYVIELKNKSEKRNNQYSHIWCVFDRDSFSAQQFNRALQIAQNHGIKVAYSNEAFEVWYILHFEYCQTGLNRSMYEAKLTKLLGSKYLKNDTAMYAKLLDKQLNAVRWAKMLIENYGEKHNPEKHNPCTKVYELVEFLNRYLEDE